MIGLRLTLIATLALTGCAGLAAQPVARQDGPSAAPPAAQGLRQASGTDDGGGVAALPAKCTAGPGPVPDQSCTPGSIDPTVTTADLCPVAHTKSRRPPESYTERLKPAYLARYGLPGPVSAYELDHDVPLELGGSGYSVWNLWDEMDDRPAPGVINSKDLVENAAHKAVCAGSLSLPDAQREIASNWLTLGRQLGVAVPR